MRRIFARDAAMDEHRYHQVGGFPSTPQMTRFDSVEATSDGSAALAREKQIKSWVRAKQLALLESITPEWQDMRGVWQGE